jgi:mRNA interferase MazF
VLVVSRNSAAPVLDRIVVVPITRTIRNIASEVPLGKAEGLPDDCAATCDNVATIPKVLLDDAPLGELSAEKTYLLDQALRFALDIRF